jgi:hypothetical protein
MKTYSIFFSKQGKGWEQAVIPTSLQECDYDSLVNWAAWQTRQKGLKGFLVSENPNPFPLLKRRARIANREIQEKMDALIGEEVLERIAV